MEKKSLLLASASPRRSKLLKDAGVVFAVVASGADETPPQGASPAEAALFAANAKADQVAAKAGGGVWVLAADTVVELEGVLFGKPADGEEAKWMLARLSGRVHRVITAVVLSSGERRHTRTVVTQVAFEPLSEAEIAWYIASGEPLDKAGAYGIQGRAAGFVKGIVGSYTNVVGLPLAETLGMLESEGLAPWSRGV